MLALLRLGAFALALTLLGGAGCLAETSTADVGSRAPSLRLEVWGHLGPAIGGKAKLGREGEARAWDFERDARRPQEPTWGFGGDLDLEVLDWASVGLTGWELTQSTGRRRIHYEGLELDGRVFPGDTRLTTHLQLRFAEASLRYVWRSDERVRLWFGLGVAWLSTRIALRGAGVRATTRSSEVFAPSLTYALSARLSERFELYLLSGIAVAPRRWPSVSTRLRVGFGYALAPGVSLRLGLGFRNALLGGTRELLSKRVRRGHDWRRIRWSSVGAELGFAFSL